MSCSSPLSIPTRVAGFLMVWVFGASFIASPLVANPTGATIRHGDITFQVTGNTLQVLQGTQHGIIDWGSFSIESGQTTRFVQPSSQSATLNRVTGRAVSRIDGNLLANGHVFLLNPNGVVIGRSGVIDVAGFTASTLDLRNEDFLNGGDLAFQGASQAALLNLGSVSAFDGDVFLVASSVVNEGSLRAPNGTVGLAAGNDVLIKESGTERVFVRGASGDRKENGVLNRGTVEANVAELKSYGGNIYGMAVKNEGRVAATAVSREGGQIFLRAGGPGRSGPTRVQSTGTLVAKKPAESDGGNIVVDSGEGGTTEVGGTVDAGGEGERGVGGTILVLGDTIDLFPESLFLADGDAGGGSIRIGGGLRGQDPGVRNATDVTVGSGVRLDASANRNGDGGEVIVFGTGDLVFGGKAEARGGSEAGDGGFVELSGKETVSIGSLVEAVDVRAPGGRNGTLLLDPNDIDVMADPGDRMGGGIGGSPVRSNTIYDTDVSNFLDGVGSLVIETDASAMGGSGNITVRNGANINWMSDSDLTFRALNGFFMEDNTRIVRNSDSSVMGPQVGSIRIHAVNGVSIGENAMGTYSGDQATIQTVDGEIEITNTAAGAGVMLNYATIGSNTGNIAIEGQGAGTGVEGVYILDSSIQSQGGAFNIVGTSMDSHGVEIASSRIETTGSEIVIRGEANSASGMNHGVHIDASMGITGTEASVKVGDNGVVRLQGKGSGGNGKAILVAGSGMLDPTYVSGGASSRIELQSLGGAVDVEGISASEVDFSDPDGVAEQATISNSRIGRFTAVNVGAVDVSTTTNLEVGDVKLANRAVFTAAGFGNNIRVTGDIDAGQEIVFNGSDSGGLFQLETPLVAPAIRFNGGAGGTDIETHGIFRLQGVTFSSINEVRGVGTKGNSVIGSDANETITVSTDSGLGGLDGIEGASALMSFSSGSMETVADIGGTQFRGYDVIGGGAGNDTFNVQLDPMVNDSTTLHGGEGDDQFLISPGGTIGTLNGGADTDTIDYSEFTTPVFANFENNTATQVGAVENMEAVIGGSAADILSGTAGADTFRITSNNGGTLNNGTFSGFEILRGVGGNDSFFFSNQATVQSIFGGQGFDSLQIDDRNLMGANTYMIGSGSIERNPTYVFNNLESLQLLLGSGDDTVISHGNGLVQILNGGGGFDTLQVPGLDFLQPNAFVFNGSTFLVVGFESPDTVVVSNDQPGNLLPLQIGNVQGPGSNPNNPNDPNGGRPINQFNDGSSPAGTGPMAGGPNPSGNAFGAAAAAIAGQAVAIQIDGGQYLLQAPASLDGAFVIPPLVVIENLRNNLQAEAWAELAAAIDFSGSSILVMSDGPQSVDLGGVPPADILALLRENLLAGAAGELAGALELTLVLPITSIDGPVGIVAIPVQIDPQVVALLAQVLEDDALAELTSSLDGE